jgi:hypothetical protein
VIGCSDQKRLCLAALRERVDESGTARGYSNMRCSDVANRTALPHPGGLFRKITPVKLLKYHNLDIGIAMVLFGATINKGGGQLNEPSSFLSIEMCPEVP